MAANYRYLPFEDRLEPAEQTEVNVIPAASPFIIKLGEVPQKIVPSTITIKEITGYDEDGEPIYGDTFTEVSTQPAQGEFYPDYYTGADGDPNWNTGQILFNSADAAKIVEITYNGIGTLVAVEDVVDTWWKGKGTGADGDFRPTSNVSITGPKNYKSVEIPAGVTVTCESANMVIFCQTTFIVKGNLVAKPLNGGVGTGGGNGGSAYQSAGYSGGASSYEVPGFGHFPYDGGKGGKGADWSQPGLGGSDLTIFTKIMYNAGTISANGGNGGITTSGRDGSGGGGGGRVAIVADALINQGTVRANGGSGSTGSATGGSNGGAGKVHLIVGGEEP